MQSVKIVFEKNCKANFFPFHYSNFLGNNFYCKLVNIVFAQKIKEMKKQKKSVIGPIFLNPEDDAKRPSRLPKLELNPDVIFNMIKLKSEKDTKGSNIQKLKESDNENFNETSEENVAKSPRGKFFSDLSDENENVKKWSNLSKIESHEKMEESKPEKSAKPGEKILKELEKENVPTLTIGKNFFIWNFDSRTNNFRQIQKTIFSIKKWCRNKINQ